MSYEILARVTLLFFCVSTGSLLLRRSSAAARHLVAVGGLVAALALPILSATFPALELPILPAADTSPLAGVVERHPAERGGSAAREEAGSIPAGALARIDIAEAGFDPAGKAVTSTARSWIALALALWLAGSLVVAARFAAGWWRLARLARSAVELDCPRTWRMIDRCRETLGLRRRPRVLTSPAVRVAAMWGVRRPVLWLPATATRWPAGRLRVVLLHELAHWKRRDGLSLVVGKLCTAAWWFHPGSWIVDRAARRDCERACDDVVLSCGERPSSYAAHLLEIVKELPQSSPSPVAALAIAGPGQLELRLRSILNPGLSRGLDRRVAAGALAMLGLGVLSVTLIQPVSRAGERKAGETADAAAPDTYVVQQMKRTSPESKVRSHEPVAADDDAGARAFEKAYVAHGEERFEDAVRGFEEAARAGYRPAVAIYNAACGLARLERTSEAVKMLRRAIDEEGFEPLELVFQDSDFDPIRREPAFRELIEQVSAHPGVSPGKQRIDRYASAVERYDDLLATDSKDAEAWEEVGLDLLQLRELDRAQHALERASERSDDATTLYNLACAYALDGEKDQALRMLERAVLSGFENEERMSEDRDLDALREDPRFERIDDLHWQLSLGRFGGTWGERSNYSARRWAPAVEEMKAFVAERPDVGRAYSNLGWAQHFSGKYEEAIEAFSHQLELGYKPAIATFNIACGHAKLGQLDQAFDWLARAVETGRFSPQQILSDEDLEVLAGDSRFEDLLDRAEQLNDDDDGMLRRVLKWVRADEPAEGVVR